MDDESPALQAKDADPMGIMTLLAGEPLGPACEKVKGGYGEFGFSLTNPIPVNGIIGAKVYLSRLVTSNGSQVRPFLFHRLGSFMSPVVKGAIDQYELVSSDASRWLTLYLHQYHPRRSRHVPGGLHLLPWCRMAELERVYAKLGLFGSNQLVPDFPFGILKLIESNQALTSVSPGLPTAIARQIRQHLLEYHGQWGKPEPDWFSKEEALKKL